MEYKREEYKDSDGLAKKKSDYSVLETKTPTLDPTYNQKVALSDDVLNKLNNMKFSYDVNGDALYQQYKNQYMQQGKLAMQDTVAQAAAMTGGYGNSYASTAGNQAYQGYLTKLNDVIPELYQLAYGKFTDEKNDLRSLYDIYRGQASDIYNKHKDDMTDWQNELARLSGDIASMQNLEYNIYSDNETSKWNQYINEQDQEWKQKEWDYTTTLDTKNDAKEMVLTLIGAGVMPDASLLKTAGISTNDARALVDKTNASLAVDDGDDEKYVYAGLDENGNKRWYKGDKEFTFDADIDPNLKDEKKTLTWAEYSAKLDNMYEEAIKYLELQGVSNTAGLMTALEWKKKRAQGNKSAYGTSYDDYVNKYIEKNSK